MTASIGSIRIKFNAESGRSVVVPIMSMQENTRFYADPDKPSTVILCQTENSVLKHGRAGMETDTYSVVLEQSVDEVWDAFKRNANSLGVVTDDKPEHHGMMNTNANNMALQASLG